MSQQGSNSLLRMESLPFYQESISVTLEDWAEKIEFLGRIISQIALDTKNGKSSALEWYSESLGDVIADYSQSLKWLFENKLFSDQSACENDVPMIEDLPFFKDDVPTTLAYWVETIESLSRLAAQLAWDSKHSGSQALALYGDRLEEVIVDYSQALKELINDEVLTVFEITSDDGLMPPLPMYGAPMEFAGRVQSEKAMDDTIGCQEPI